MKKSLVLGMLASLTLGTALQAEVLFTEDFSKNLGGSVPSAGIYSEFNYWYHGIIAGKPDNGNTVRNDDWSDNTNPWWWSTAGIVHTSYYVAPGNGIGTSDVNSGPTTWLMNNVSANNLQTDLVTNAALSADMSMTWGGNGNGLRYYIGLFDDAGNGYIGELGRENNMVLYRLTDWMVDSVLANSAGGTAGNGRNVTLSVIDGKVTLTSSIGGVLSVTDTSYSAFTTVGFSGYFTAGEVVAVDNVVLSGDRVAVPEPASLSMLALAAGGLLLSRRK